MLPTAAHFVLLFPRMSQSALFLHVLQPFKARQVHGIQADGIIFTELWGCLTCLYSREGNPHTLQAPYPHVSPHDSACHLSPLSLSGKSQLPYILNTDKAGEEPGLLYTTARFCACEPTQGYGNGLLDPVSRLCEHY